MLTIVSGAAPGVEQAAIEAAVDLALRWQGWAALDHVATLSHVYRAELRTTVATDPGMVRRLNVQEAMGSLVISTSMVLVGVAAFVDRATEQMERAFLHVTINPGALRAPLPSEVVGRVQGWIRDNHLSSVYVTGPIEDAVPGIQRAARAALIAILEPFAIDEWRETRRQLNLLGELVAVPWARKPPESIGPATRTDLAEFDAVPEPVDSDAPARTFANLVVIGEVTSPDFRARTTKRCQANGSHLFIDRGDASRCQFCGVALAAACARRVPCVVADPPEGLDDAQRAELDASIRDAERDILHPQAPGEPA